jgi:hypothetical protein
VKLYYAETVGGRELSACVICKKKAITGSLCCSRKACLTEYKVWAVANYDLLPDSNFKLKYEDDFWQVTPEQKKHFARFYELMRPPQKRIARKCRKCGDTMPIPKLDNNTYRICKTCHSSNSHLGALAYASSM